MILKLASSSRESCGAVFTSCPSISVLSKTSRFWVMSRDPAGGDTSQHVPAQQRHRDPDGLAKMTAVVSVANWPRQYTQSLVPTERKAHLNQTQESMQASKQSLATDGMSTQPERHTPCSSAPDVLISAIRLSLIFHTQCCAPPPMSTYLRIAFLFLFHLKQHIQTTATRQRSHNTRAASSRTTASSTLLLRVVSLLRRVWPLLVHHGLLLIWTTLWRAIWSLLVLTWLAVLLRWSSSVVAFVCAAGVPYWASIVVRLRWLLWVTWRRTLRRVLW